MPSILHDLYAFYLDHQRCGELDSGVDGERVWMACTCGARISITYPVGFLVACD